MADFNAQKISKIKAIDPDASYSVESTDKANTGSFVRIDGSVGSIANPTANEALATLIWRSSSNAD